MEIKFEIKDTNSTIKNKYAQYKEYVGVINSEGKLLFSNENWLEMTPLSSDRAFVRDSFKKWRMIDNQGNYIGNSKYNEILYGNFTMNIYNFPFYKSRAVVRQNNNWFVIDSNRSYLDTMNIDLEKVNGYKYIIGSKIVFQDQFEKDGKTLGGYGFYNLENGKYVLPIYNDLQLESELNELIYAEKDGLSYYLNDSGEIIWEEKLTKSDSLLNIDFMNRGYYYASNKNLKELAGYGGWASSTNLAKSENKTKNNENRSLELLFDNSKNVVWLEKYKGMNLNVVNYSKDTLYFDAQDSRLEILMQAKDVKGVWRDIEYLPSSWCGNSYHKLFLAPNEYWEFVTPIYNGEFKTKLRAKINYKTKIKQKDNSIMYSQEIDGSINPGQFWNKGVYSPNSLMDPYND